MITSNFCHIFNIDCQDNKDLYNYVDTYQTQLIQQYREHYSDTHLIETYLNTYLQQLVMSRFNNRTVKSFYNDFRVYMDNNEIVIDWNIYNPALNRWHYVYNLDKDK